jgi:hypothetical protein
VAKKELNHPATAVDNQTKPGKIRDTATAFCIECGAANDMLTCEEALNAILTMEPECPKLQAEHFKTVACYIIQHPATYLNEAVEGLINALEGNLNGKLSVDEIRKCHDLMFAGSRKVKKKHEDVRLVQKQWQMTIMDCYVPAECETTAENIIKWARSIVSVAKSDNVYEFEAVIQASAVGKGGTYVAFPYDLRIEFGKGRVKVHATFDGEPYDGSIVNMGVKNADGTVCYIIGLRKDIRCKIGKQAGDTVRITITERQRQDRIFNPIEQSVSGARKHGK